MTLNKFDLSGKIAIVTGGAGLLGKEHTLALIDSGAFVWVADIDYQEAKNFCKSLDGRGSPILLNVGDNESVKGALKKILSQSGVINILINNAAINPSVNSNGDINSSRLEYFDLEDWNNQINVGLTGAFLCSKYFGSWMAKNNSGVILNIASDLSVIAPDQRIYRKKGIDENKQQVKPITYSIIKTALIGLTKYLATYWADNNIRVNALSPGGIYDNQNEDFIQKLTSLIPLGRMAKRDEYRSAIQFLCSDASSYMTGQNIIIDGGRSVW
jgi:NAD(P)-dependent dehydrogenase (short-subunit alcohol dehydrogenase family)